MKIKQGRRQRRDKELLKRVCRYSVFSKWGFGGLGREALESQSNITSSGVTTSTAPSHCGCESPNRIHKDCPINDCPIIIVHAASL